MIFLFCSLKILSHIFSQSVARSLSATAELFDTDRVSQDGKAIGSVRLSARLSVRLFSLYLLNRLTFELEFMCVIMTIVHLRLKVKSTGQGQSAYGRGNAVTRSV